MRLTDQQRAAFRRAPRKLIGTRWLVSECTIDDGLYHRRSAIVEVLSVKHRSLVQIASVFCEYFWHRWVPVITLLDPLSTFTYCGTAEELKEFRPYSWVAGKSQFEEEQGYWMIQYIFPPEVHMWPRLVPGQSRPQYNSFPYDRALEMIRPATKEERIEAQALYGSPVDSPMGTGMPAFTQAPPTEPAQEAPAREEVLDTGEPGPSRYELLSNT